jgi:hypothetical protein
MDAAAALSGPDQQTGLMAGGALFGLSLVVVGVWAFRRFYLLPKRESTQVQTSRDANSVADSGASEFDNVESVLDAIIALDELRGAGKLSEEAYYNRRKELFMILESMNGGAGQTGE